MLRKKTIENIGPRIESALRETLHLSRFLQKRRNDVVVWLENGYYEKGIEGYIIGPGMDHFNDLDRNQYCSSYVKEEYELRIGQIDDPDENSRLIKKSIRQELSIYQDFWESVVALRILRNLVNLLTLQAYDWRLQIDKSNKSQIIREEIRDKLEGLGCDLGSIIRESYATQIRNAIAHRDFRIDENHIVLLNYQKQEYCNFRSLTLDEWEHRFALTFLLNNELLSVRAKLRKLLSKEATTWDVSVPSKQGGYRLLKLKYEPTIRRFQIQPY